MVAIILAFSYLNLRKLTNAKMYTKQEKCFLFCIRVFQKFLKNLMCAIRKNYWGKRKKSAIILHGKKCLGKAR